ncbi:MAG TPA: TlpA disulfide reductase family protein [Candidatus Koribacter sp.]|jgi:thiol-disulfide isomerase/thioredoxin
MMKSVRFLALLLLAVSSVSVVAMASDKYSGTPAAKAEFEKGKVALESQNWEKAAAAFKKATEIDPNYADAHDQYMLARENAAIGDFKIFSTGTEEEKKKMRERTKKVGEEITQEYEDLVKQHPDMPIYKWALAQRYDESNPELQGKYCKEALAQDPDFGPGYSCVGSVASLGGDNATAMQSYRKLVELQPDNKESWRLLQWTASHGDPQQYKAITDEIVQKFPDSDTAVEALMKYTKSLPQDEQIAQFEEIVAKYPPKKVPASAKAAEELFARYDSSDPAKAAAFAHKVQAEIPDDKDWKKHVEYADGMANAEAKIKANDGAGALAILKNVKVPTYIFNKTRLELLQAKANDISGKTADAYADLLKVFAATPERDLQGPLYDYGKKLGKSDSAIDGEVWKARADASKPEIPFTLDSFVDGKKVSLADYKGKVVLIDFWYPNCGPCMNAMPYLEDLYNKYKDSGLVFLGINGFEEQAAFVMPLVKARGWGFLPLKGDKKFCEDVYKVRGFPSTFLIGADGRVYFKPFTYDHHQEEIADMQIQALLAAAKQ